MDKPRWVEVTEPAEKAALLGIWSELNAPAMSHDDGVLRANADDLRAWRSQNTSTVKHGQ